ncbi:redoxin family protein [Sphingobacterium sp. Mn56C]|uniref:redoxin family protein n=1 Tax=Sphingobacterium sp. Mn56C TaxID=3395261 RepID=UPI003BBE86CC
MSAPGKKKKNIISNLLFVVAILILLWPTSRLFLQQQLMKIGFFRPALEAPAIGQGEDKVDITAINTDKAVFVDDQERLYDTEKLKGKVVFINFWATWCGPCRAEMPSIQQLYNKFKANDNLVFLLVEIENDSSGTQKFLARQKLQLPIVYPSSTIPKNWLGGSIPTTVILNKAGNIAAKEEGMADYSTKKVVDFIQNLLDQ